MVLDDGESGSGSLEDATEEEEPEVRLASLLWTMDGESIEAPVLLDYIAIRMTDTNPEITLDPVTVLEAFGAISESVQEFGSGGWWLARLPGHLATVEGHEDLAAMLVNLDFEVSPVIAVGAEEVALVERSVLVGFEPHVGRSWRERVIELVSPGANLDKHGLPETERAELASAFGGDALADAAALGERNDVRWADPDWRLMRVDGDIASTLESVPIGESVTRWRGMRADLNYDGRIDGADIEIVMLAALGEGASHRFDLDGDGVVNMADFAWALTQMGATSNP